MSHLKLKCTKFDFSWASTPDPAAELAALLKPLAGFKVAYFSREKRRKKGVRSGEAGSGGGRHSLARPLT